MGFIMQLGSAWWFCIRVSGVNLFHWMFSLISFIFFRLFLILGFLNFRDLLEELRLPSLGVDLSKPLYICVSVYKSISSYIIYSIKLSDILPSCNAPTSTLTQCLSKSCSVGKGCSDSELKRALHIEADGLPFLIEHSKLPKILNWLQSSCWWLKNIVIGSLQHPHQLSKPHLVLLEFIRDKYLCSVFCVLRERETEREVFFVFGIKVSKMSSRLLWASRAASYLRISVFHRGFASGIYQTLLWYIVLYFPFICIY